MSERHSLLGLLTRPFRKQSEGDTSWEESALDRFYAGGAGAQLGARTGPSDSFSIRGERDFDQWDERLDQVDRTVELEERERQRWWQRRFWRGRRKLWWVARIIASAIFVFFLLIAWLALTVPLSKSLEPIVPPQMTLLAADGTPIARNGAVTAEPVTVEALPEHVIEPFLAIEDRRFYSHWGIDPRGLARAAWTNVTTGRTQGGSTITQQLAKFTFLTSEQSMTRKAREAMIAFWLEAWLTKDEILERYLSNAYFGDNTYGLRAASMHYFYRKPENLKPEQAAMLAGLLKAPSRLAPTRNPDLAEERMRVVIGSMVAAGYLTQAEAEAMPTPRVDLRKKEDLPTGTYFADWAMPQARAISEASYSQQQITTTLDPELQRLAGRLINGAKLGKAQAALVAMRPTGEVVAMVGGKNYAESPFNRATQAQRQPGSTFKLFVWLAAIKAGLDADDVINNSEFTQGSYRPRNANDRYSDEITLADGFAQSSNVAAVRLFGMVGDKAVIETARGLGISSPLAENDPSLALGTSEVNLLELTAAYAGVASNSWPVEPRAFAAEEPGWFDWVFDGKSSFSKRQHEAIQSMLRQAINTGTGRAAMLPIANFGKTGTSQGNRDALFVGYAGDLVVGVWVGNDDGTPLAGVSGGGLPARIWKDFMRGALKIQAPATPAPSQSADPEAPIEPFDVPELEDIPLGDTGASVTVDDGVTVSTEIEGLPVDIRLDREGVNIEPGDPRNRRDEE